MQENEIQIDCHPKCWTVLLSEVRSEEFWTSKAGKKEKILGMEQGKWLAVRALYCAFSDRVRDHRDKAGTRRREAHLGSPLPDLRNLSIGESDNLLDPPTFTSPRLGVSSVIDGTRVLKEDLRERGGR